MSDYQLQAEQEMWDEIVANDPGPMAPASVHNPSAPGAVAAPKERPEGTYECDGCNGSGVYYGAGRVENGKFIGFSGKCYRCGGKGHQTQADRRRNACYDRHRIVRI